MEKDYYALFAAHHRRLIGNVDQLGKHTKEDVLNTSELLTYLWEHLVPHAQGEEVTLYKRAEALPGGSGIVQPMGLASTKSLSDVSVNSVNYSKRRKMPNYKAFFTPYWR